jgi:large subunit ribosomal protein L24
VKIAKNDTVIVVSGDDKGKVGKVLKVFSKGHDVPQVVVEKVNFIKRHTRKTQQNPQGGIIEREAPVPISNVMLYCSKCGTGIRVGYRRLGDGTKVRYCRKCDEIIMREEK